MGMTNIQICRLALRKLGSPVALNGFTDDTVEARLCSELYDHVLRLVLSEHNWRFATKRVELVQDTNVTPLYEFDYAFTIPSDCLKILEIKDNPTFISEDGYIYTDESELEAKYVYIPETTANFPHLFCEAVATRLAIEIGESIGATIQKVAFLENKYKEALQQAIKHTATQRTKYTDDVPDPDWLNPFGDSSIQEWS